MCLSSGRSAATSCQPGNRRSRDIAQVSRTPVIMITSPQAKIEITTRISSRSPMNDPSTILITSAIGVLEAASLTGSFAAAVTASRNRNPRIPEASTACHIARGTTRSGSWVSSARFAADSNPTIVNAPSSVPSRNGPTCVAEPNPQYPWLGIAPLLNRLCSDRSRAITPTTSSNTTSANIPASSTLTAKLLIRSDHRVEYATSNACTASTTPVMIHAFVSVPV